MKITLINLSFKEIIAVTIVETEEHKFFICDECITIYRSGSFDHIKDEHMFDNLFRKELNETIKYHEEYVSELYNKDSYMNKFNACDYDKTWNEMVEWLKTL